jgi:hypothetical protein
LLFMKAASSVSPKGAELGRFRKMRKKDIVWIRNPNITIGSRPHRIVFDPRIPKKAPPIIKIIHITWCKTIQVLQRLQASTMVQLRPSLFWDVTWCRLIFGYQYFGTT